MVEGDYKLFVGVDWATEAHEVRLIDGQGKVRHARSVEHSGAGITAFVDWLDKESCGRPGCVAVAIEIPRGAVVEALAERGFHVYSINPKQLDRFRDRHTVAGAKDDSRDAYVLADSLRTDRHLFRRVQIDDPLVIQIRELSRMDEDLRRESNALSNRLREQLHRFYPQMLKLCPAANEPWLWALLVLAPTPTKAKRIRRESVKKLLRTHRIRRIDAETALATLREPAVHVAPGTVEAATQHIEMLTPRLRLVYKQRKQCTTRIEQLLDELQSDDSEGSEREHRDVDIIRSLPGVGTRVSATMLAEASTALAARDYHALRAHGGVAPVTRQSGKRKSVLMRHGCSGRLRNAFYHWARVAVQHDPICGTRYEALRKRGHTHGRALRTVADRLLRILVAMLKAGTVYDRTKPRAYAQSQAARAAEIAASLG